MITMEPEPIRSIDDNKQSIIIPKPLNTVIQMPYTVVTKMTPVIDDLHNTDKNKI